ncbi:MAG: ABC transporter permease [Roseivirga sp.]
MLQHNLILTLRGYLRHKGSFLINLTGLSTGIACTLLIYLWVNSELQMNQFHENNNQLYQIISNSTTTNGILSNHATPGDLAEAMKEELPEVEMAVNQTWTNTFTLSYDETNLKAVGQYVGKDYFNVFSYELIQGDKSDVLSEQRNILISDQLAYKLFGTLTDVVGKTVKFQQFRDYSVSGIFKKPPSTSSYQFDFIMTFEEYKELNSWVLNWKNNGPSTFVVLAKGTDIDAFNDKIKDFIKSHNGNENTTPMATLFSDLYLQGKFENGKPVGGKISDVRTFSIIAIVILVIACINFINLTTARISRRVKEIGVKKTLGASRESLGIQFLFESFAISTLSLMVALVLVSVALPEFSNITGKELKMVLDNDFILTLSSVLIITSFIAGSYPAIYLSAIKPMNILKPQLNNGFADFWIRKGLVVIQFSISIMLIVFVMVVNNQIQLTRDKDIGFNKDNVLYFEADGQIELKMETFLQEVSNIPGVKTASSSAHSFVEGGYTGLTYNVSWNGKDSKEPIGMEYMRVNYDLIELLDLEILEGRSFSREFKSEYNKVIFNEKAIAIMGLENPIGATVTISGKNTQIVGIAKDFNFKTFHKEVGPAYFVLKPDDTWLIMTKLTRGSEAKTIAGIGELYSQFNPGFPFDFRFLDQDYEAQYKSEQRVGALSEYFSMIAILISCLGLLGLASFATEKRIKEIGIRKVLGSSQLEIVRTLSKEFTQVVIVAIIIALPISYIIADNWLSKFVFRIELGWWFFVAAGASALLITWITVSFQTLKAARSNPVDCLRNE